MALVERYVSVAGGGAHDGTSEANAFTWAEMITNSATAADGTRYNIKAGSYSRTTATDAFGVGSATGPLIFRGYSSVITDGYQGRTGDNGALVTTNMPTVTYTTGGLSAGSFTVVEALNITSAKTTSGTLFLGANSFILRCKVDNTVAGVNGVGIFYNSSNAIVIDCDVTETGATGAGPAIGDMGTGSVLIGCRLKSTSGNAVRINVSSIVGPLIAFNTMYVNGTAAIGGTGTANALRIIYNTIVGNATSGIDMVAQSVLNLVMGNMLTDNGAYAGNFGGAASAFATLYNRTRDNTSGTYNNAADWISATSFSEVTTDTGGATSDYVDPASNDYTLDALSPAIGMSIPLFASMGALQASASGGGTGNGMIPTIKL